MATSKTLAPTNVTISIPEFTDQPDQRVNSNCIDKLGDAVNALNSNIAMKDTQITRESAVTHALTVSDSSCNVIFLAGTGGTRLWGAMVFKASSGMTVAPIVETSNVSYSASGNTLSITFSAAQTLRARVINVYGNLIS